MMNGELKVWEQDNSYVAKQGHRTYFYSGADYDLGEKGNHLFHTSSCVEFPAQVNYILFFVDKGDYSAFGFSKLPEVPCTLEEGKKHFIKMWTPPEIRTTDDVLSELVNLFAKDIVD